MGAQYRVPSEQRARGAVRARATMLAEQRVLGASTRGVIGADGLQKVLCVIEVTCSAHRIAASARYALEFLGNFACGCDASGVDELGRNSIVVSRLK